MNNFNGKILQNKYEFIQPIGKGGMGTVYLSRDLKIDCFWAIKVIKKDKENSADLLAEPNLLKKLIHPSLPRITDIIEDKNYLYIVMDFIDGRGLDAVIKENKSIDEATTIKFAKELCDVLNYLHSQKPHPIIYRDMKPSNILLTKDGHLKLIDFGIAREFKYDSNFDTTYLGTRGFAAPEQYKDSSNETQTDARTDIYGLGVTLYNMLTGKRPDEPPYELKPLREMNPKLSEGIEFIVGKCTQIDPNLRYQNVGELLYDINNIDKIGMQYKYKHMIKIGKAVGCVFLMAFCVFIIFLGWNTYNKGSDEKYDEYIKEGQKLESQMNYTDALNEFKKAENFDPEKKNAYYEISKTYMSMWSLDDSLRYLDRQAQLNNQFKNDEYTKYLMGKTYFLKCNYKLALQYLNEVKNSSNVDKDFQPIKNICNELVKNNSDYHVLKDNILKFERYIDENTDDNNVKLNLYISASDLYLQLASLLDPRNTDERMANIQSQLDILTKANNIDSSNYTVMSRMASVYRERARNIRFSDKEKYQKYLAYALDYYSKCLTVQKSIDVYKDLGDTYVEMEKIKEAENAYNEMIKINPDNYLGYLKLALLYYSENNINKAKDYLSKCENSKYFTSNDPSYLSLKRSIENKGV